MRSSAVCPKTDEASKIQDSQCRWISPLSAKRWKAHSAPFRTILTRERDQQTLGLEPGEGFGHCVGDLDAIMRCGLNT